MLSIPRIGRNSKPEPLHLPLMQLRNLVLSAFSRDMKLPDPFTPNLRIELLPEISQAPVFLPAAEALLPPQLKCAIQPPYRMSTWIIEWPESKPLSNPTAPIVTDVNAAVLVALPQEAPSYVRGLSLHIRNCNGGGSAFAEILMWVPTA